MFSVLIVDDEKLDREGLKRQLEWSRYGIEEIFLAENGFEAIDIIKNNNINILLTDVKMPGLSGIQLVRKINEVMPDNKIKIIFISGFDDFEYVKGALELNACQYILKPVDTDELSSAVKKAVDSLEKESQYEKEKKTLLNCLNESIPLLRKKIIEDLIFDTVDRENIWTKITEIGMNFRKGIAIVLIAEIDDYKKLAYEMQKNHLANVMSKVEDFIKQSMFNFNDKCSAEYSKIDDSKIVIILTFPENEHRKGAEKISKQIAEIIAGDNCNISQISITVAMGSVVESLDKICISYNVASKALIQKFYEGKGRVLSCCEEEYCATNSIKYDSIDTEFSRCIINLDINKAEHLIDYFFDNLQKTRTYSNDFLKYYCIHIFSKIEITLLEINESFENIFGNSSVLWDKLDKFETILDIRRWMKNIFKAVIEYLEHKNDTKNKKIVEQIINIIENNYHEDITLKQIAESLYYSPNYLGNIFKEETGKIFSDFLIEYRMKKAAQLFNDTRLKIYQISQMVGYKNIPSFIRQFKAVYGLTPIQYRKRCLK